MGFMTLFSPCGCCGATMMCNPKYVPSYDFGREEGKEPVCKNCMELINARRVELGMPAFEIHPEAYEPLDEDEYPSD